MSQQHHRFPGRIAYNTKEEMAHGFGGTRCVAVRYLSYAARQMQDGVRQRKTLLLGMCIAVLRRVLLSYTAPPNTPHSTRTPAPANLATSTPPA